MNGRRMLTEEFSEEADNGVWEAVVYTGKVTLGAWRVGRLAELIEEGHDWHTALELSAPPPPKKRPWWRQFA